MDIIEKLAGRWIANEDMHPTTNIAGRRYFAITLGGEIEGKYMGNGWWPTHDGLMPPNLFWHFPSDTE